MTNDELQTRLDGLRLRFEQMARIPHDSYEEFSSDFRNVATAIYLLQTAIQALIDIGGFHVARLGLAVPRRNLEVFENLEAAGHFRAGTTVHCASIVGFRNRAVFLYDQIDDRIVYDILVEQRRDLADLMDLLLAIDQ